MIRNYLRVAIRRLMREKTTSLITIGGLAVGLACCILILLYVADELQYDRYHVNADAIRRVEIDNWAATAVGVGPYMERAYPGVRATVRFLRMEGAVAGNGPDTFIEKRFFYADSDVFRVFTFHLAAGDPSTALSSPNSVVLTQRMAGKYFGTEDPLGRTLQIRTARPASFTVTGVMDDPPPQSHFQFDAFASLCTLRFPEDNARLQWSEARVYTYALLRPHADEAGIERDLQQVIRLRTDTPDTASLSLLLRPLTDIHLHAACEKEIEPQGSILEVSILSSVALFVLFLAVVNFINLTTARSVRRSREAAVRKTLGAQPRQIVAQFVGESLIVTLLAAVCAVALVACALPAFNGMTGKSISLWGGDAPLLLAGTACLICLVGFAAGSYPAFYLSRFHPVRILKSGPRPESPSSAAATFRQGLVVLQFVVSIALVAGSIIIGEQLGYLRDRDLGMDRGHVIILPVSAITAERYDALKAELLKNSGVAAVTASYSVPGERVVVDEVRPESARKDSYYFRMLLCDYDFPETYGLTVKEGRSFSRGHGSDTSSAFMINEQAAVEMGWASPVGKSMRYPTLKRSGEVIGVVRDFNYASLHQAVEPLVICLTPKTAYYKYISLRLTGGNTREVMDNIRSTWRRVMPGAPFEYTFLDANLLGHYRAEQELGTIVSLFTVIGLTVACLGLFALMSLAVAERTKEIGVRKVLGASVSVIVALLARYFLRLVLIANLLAWPVAWFAMHRWLGTFAFRIGMTWWPFILSGCLALAVAVLTVGVQAVKAAMANPVEALRYE